MPSLIPPHRLLLPAALLCLAAPPRHARADEAKDAAAMATQKHPVDHNPPAPQGKTVELKVAGGSSAAYAAHPKGHPKGGVLVLHEWWGLNDWVRHMADTLAGEGYLALAVDLYKGVVATTPDDAKKAMGALDGGWAEQVERAGIEWLKAQGKGKVATIGWCMGGRQSLLASLAAPQDVAATVIYYGFPVNEVEKLKTLRGPVLGLWGKKDGAITPEKVAEFEKALAAAGVKYTGHSYDADHAFANPTGGRHNPDAAKDAWEKTRAFLAQALQ